MQNQIQYFVYKKESRSNIIIFCIHNTIIAFLILTIMYFQKNIDLD